MINSQLILDKLCWSLRTISYEVHTTGNLVLGLPFVRLPIILVLKISSRSFWLPWYIMTGNEGVHFWNSSIQFESVLRGATMRWGPR